MKRLAALALALLLSGCGAQALIGGLGSGGSQISGAAAGLFGIPAATISQQMTAEIAGIQTVAGSLQMLKAQLDGVPVSLPPLPLPSTPLNPGAPAVGDARGACGNQSAARRGQSVHRQPYRNAQRSRAPARKQSRGGDAR